MKTYITSDLHFGHVNILKFCASTRQYNDVDHMNDLMIKEWNSIVKPEDLTYILGDFAFCNAERATSIAYSLNGRKILIEGNHDRKILKDDNFRNCFEEIHKYHEVNVDKTKVCMFHYPIAEWNQCYSGSVHFHGHLHGSRSGIDQYRALDVGMDAMGAIAIEMNEMIALAMKKSIKTHHN